ncbi:MAG: sulfite exporter TauE/SafE family protein [Roseiflexaceae bacterium]
MTSIFLISVIIFLAALIKVTLGFGESLLAMPLLTLVIGLPTATPLVGLVAATLTLLMLGSSWRQIDLRATWRLLGAAALGVPIGVLLVRLAPAMLVSRMLGVMLIGFGLFSLFRPALIKLAHPSWSYVFGFLAGVLGSAYNTAGPPLVIYSAARRWPPDQFRATMQSVFLPICLLVLLSHALAGLWSPWVFELYALSLPLLLLAIWLGRQVHRHISEHRFDRLVYITLLVLGLLLLR